MPKSKFRFLTNEEFARLTPPEKMRYIALAYESLHALGADVTDKPTDKPEKSEKRRKKRPKTQ